MKRKLKSATIVETVVALVILMISFTAGMVIYNQIVGTGVNQRRLQADTDAEFVLDSLLSVGGTQNQLVRKGDRRIDIQFSQDTRFPDISVVRAICRDENGRLLAAVSRMIAIDERQD